MDGVVERIKKYKEIVVGVVAIGSSLLVIAGVQNHFATKFQINVLRCQVDAGRTLLNSKILDADLGKQLTLRMKERFAKVKEGVDAASLIELDQEIESLKGQMKMEQATRVDAQGRLGEGKCEQLVRGK